MTPVFEHLPEWADVTVARAGGGVESLDRPITIRDLLTHTSGIPYGVWINGKNDEAWAEAGFDGWYLAGKDQSIRDVARAMADLPIAQQPGSEFLYGYNTDILGAAISAAVTRPRAGPSRPTAIGSTKTYCARNWQPCGTG